MKNGVNNAKMMVTTRNRGQSSAGGQVKMYSENGIQMLKCHIMLMMLHMKARGYGAYKEMSFLETEKKASQAMNGEITVKEHMILIMCNAKQSGYGKFKDMSYKQIEELANGLKDGDKLYSWNNQRNEDKTRE